MNKTDINSIVENIKLLTEDTKEFLLKVKSKYVIDDLILKLLKNHDLKYSISESENHPLVKVNVDMGSFEKGIFKINYNFMILFSKLLTKVTHDYFTFEVVNRDPNRISSVLSNDSYHPLTQNQFKFFEEYKLVAKKIEYVRLSRRDLEFVVCSETHNFKGLHFFGDQPTLEMLVFNDFFNLIPE
tara:strand:- start:455 stop:1009 length:555 start_codon:yes stop_codon:yes gene_type:complete